MGLRRDLCYQCLVAIGSKAIAIMQRKRRMCLLGQFRRQNAEKARLIAWASRVSCISGCTPPNFGFLWQSQGKWESLAKWKCLSWADIAYNSECKYNCLRLFLYTSCLILMLITIDRPILIHPCSWLGRLTFQLQRATTRRQSTVVLSKFTIVWNH